MLLKKQKDEVTLLKKIIERQNKDNERIRREKNRLEIENSHFKTRYV